MHIINVNIENSYNIYVGISIDLIGNHIKKNLNPKKVIVVYDHKLQNLYLPKLNSSLLQEGFTVLSVPFVSSEQNKTLQNAFDLCNNILNCKIDKSTVIVALGGGVVGDVVGFCASILLRGLPYVHVPTTLLAQVDSSIGGKTGVNTILGKNLIGTIYQPSAVFIDVTTLQSLSAKDILSGYGECLKYALLFNKEYFYQLNSINLTNLSHEQIVDIIVKSCSYKSEIIALDVDESKGYRHLLNLGHTFAHALESLNNYNENLSHGEAVALGCLLALKFSNFLGLCKTELIHDLENHLQNKLFRCTISSVVPKFNINNMLNFMMQDKKNHKGFLRMILFKDIGNCYVDNNVNIQSLHDFLIKETI